MQVVKLQIYIQNQILKNDLSLLYQFVTHEHNNMQVIVCMNFKTKFEFSFDKNISNVAHERLYFSGFI